MIHNVRQAPSPGPIIAVFAFGCIDRRLRKVWLAVGRQGSARRMAWVAHTERLRLRTSQQSTFVAGPSGIPKVLTLNGFLMLICRLGRLSACPR